MLGISLGGEWASSAVYIAELSKFRAFWISFVQVEVPIGLVISSLFALNRYEYLTLSLISLVLLILSFKIAETPLFLEVKGRERDVSPFSSISIK